MPSDCIRDAVSAARILLGESDAARRTGGMTVQESASLMRMERAAMAFLDEVGAL